MLVASIPGQHFASHVGQRKLRRYPPPPSPLQPTFAIAQVWDMRQKQSVATLEEKYQVCSVAFSAAGDQVPPCVHSLCVCSTPFLCF